MPLPVLVRTLIEKKVGDFCKKRVPAHVKDKVSLSYAIRGNSITIFENRAPWRPDVKDWSSMPIAQIRYDTATGKCMLYCADRNDKWHRYMGIEPTNNIDEILDKIDKDPSGIFWG